MAKVSVVVPVYNVEKYLEQCLDSIVNQTLEDIEIICVNDGSTDSSYGILKRYEKMDSRIKVISKENSGYGHTINTGVEAASGKYITIIESDDFAETNMMEKMYEAAELYQVDVVKCNYYHYCEGENTYVESLKGFEYNTPFYPIEKLDVFTLDASSNFMWKRIPFKKNGLRMNQTEGASFQDISFQFQILFYAKQVVFLSDALLHYRIDNINSSVNNSKKIFCVCNEFINIRNIMESSGKNVNAIYPYIVKNKCRTFKWNYTRISEEYQYAFLIKWRDELIEDYEIGILKKELFNEQEWTEIYTIMYDKEQYFCDTAKCNFLKKIIGKTVNEEIYSKALLEHISESQNVIIYGCGKIGKKIATNLVNQSSFQSYCFAVSDDKYEEGLDIMGIPIVSVSKLRGRYPAETLVVVTVQDKDKRKVVSMIQKQGYEKIMLIEDKIKEMI